MAVWPERGKEPEMILRRGIFLGVIMIAGSVQAICGGYGPEAARFVWIWWITLLVGIVQLGVSFHYRMALFSRIMQFCLVLEGIYYIGLLIWLLVWQKGAGKWQGILLALLMLCVIVSALYTTGKAVAERKKK